jgi:hypothetical protein
MQNIGSYLLHIGELFLAYQLGHSRKNLQTMSQPLCISPKILKLNCGAPFCTSGVCYLTYLDCTLTLDPYSLPGVHFKRWCVMQSKIRAGTLNEVLAYFNLTVMTKEYMPERGQF